MINKYKISFMLNIFLIAIILSIFVFEGYKAQNKKVSFYSIERTSSDLALTIENLNLLTFEHGLYIEPNYSMRPNLYTEDEIKDIHIKISIDNQPIINLYFSDMNVDHVQSAPIFINSIDSITDNSKIYINFTYTINGKNQNFETNLKLKDFKADILYDNSNYISKKDEIRTLYTV